MTAVENISKWFNVSSSESKMMISSTLKKVNLSERASFWFLRSLSLNRNISNKPFENINIEDKQNILDIYCVEHKSIDSSEECWPNYISAKNNLKNLTIEGFTPKYDYVPSWLYSKDLTSRYTSHYGRYIDAVIYPIFPNESSYPESYQSILVNYIVNNYQEIVIRYASEINLSMNKSFFDNLVEKSFHLNYQKDPMSALSFILSSNGIYSFIEEITKNKGSIFNDAKGYFNTNGYVFPKDLPKMPYGFDTILAINNSIDGVHHPKLWAN